MAELLGVHSVPELSIAADSRYEQGRRVTIGRQLSWAELDSTTIGEPLEPESDTEPGSLHYDIDISGCHDGLWLMVIDHQPEYGSEIEAVFSPYRTCVSVVVATALALTVAELAGGKFTDEIHMLQPHSSDPRHVITTTHLPRTVHEFPAACERWLRQFPNLRDWPSNVSMP